MNPVDFSFEEVNGAKVAILKMNLEGKFNPALLEQFNRGLDDAIADEETQAIILTGEGKNFSQGLDLESMSQMEGPVAAEFVNNCMEAVGRLLLFPIPVVSAVNGHAFGLGAMITLASDYAVMRDDRGFFCLPEVNIQINLIPSMNALVCAKLHGKNLRDVLLTGKYVGGIEAAERGIVDASASEADLLTVAKALPQDMMGKGRSILKELKTGINEPILPKHFV